ncbi:hypothetical protein AAFM46_06885 [Arthrobacter sp. TMP15]|uniref:hypothetical protein n=1 Tax=Arthrobacter sp. TMP15 TaxID=3140789 RepID=UPI0031BB2B2C
MGITVPLAAVAVFLGVLLSGSGLGESIAAAVVGAVNVAFQVAFWVTVVFAVIDHTSMSDRTLTAWTPDRLPRIPSGAQITVIDSVIDAAGLLVFAGAIVWQQLSSLFQDSTGTPIPLLAPGLWSLWFLNMKRLLNPDFLTMVQQATALHVQTPSFYIIISVIVIGLLVWKIIDGFVKVG